MEALAKPPSSVLQAPYSEARIQNWNPLTGNVFCYSDSCILYSDFSLANTPEGFCKSLYGFSAAPAAFGFSTGVTVIDIVASIEWFVSIALPSAALKTSLAYLPQTSPSTSAQP